MSGRVRGSPVAFRPRSEARVRRRASPRSRRLPRREVRTLRRSDESSRSCGNGKGSGRSRLPEPPGRGHDLAWYCGGIGKERQAAPAILIVGGPRGCDRRWAITKIRATALRIRPIAAAGCKCSCGAEKNLLETEAEHIDDEPLDRWVVFPDGGGASVRRPAEAGGAASRRGSRHEGATGSDQSLQREMAVDVRAVRRRFVCSLP